ncbi:unnamed protein product, partial [Prorocentrum cordatum]
GVSPFDTCDGITVARVERYSVIFHVDHPKREDRMSTAERLTDQLNNLRNTRDTCQTYLKTFATKIKSTRRLYREAENCLT